MGNETIEESDELDAPNASEDGRAKKLEELQSRAAAAELEVRSAEYSDGDVYYYLGLRAGRNTRWVSVLGDRLDDVLAIRFEKYSFLSGYEALLSATDGVIEAGIVGIPLSTYTSLRHLTGISSGPPDSGALIIEPPEGHEDLPRLVIGPPSKEFQALTASGIGSRRVTLTLTNVTATRHDEARALLKRISDSLFFQIDMLVGSTFVLERERRRRFRRGGRRSLGEQTVTYPRSEFEEAPTSLYWYARSADRMPLLQFLAYYQCLEFFFPTYSQAEARRRIVQILKDPAFRVDREGDVGRLLSAIRINRSGAIGDERAQLRATILECVGEHELREFLTADEDREQYFSGKGRKQKFHKIPIANPSADLRNDVADRLYDIRCRIVHTKQDSHGSDVEMILPFTEEADYLEYDIELAQFLAQSAMVASSRLIF